MLCGRFPWAVAGAKSVEFRKYQAQDFTSFPWTRLGPIQLTLVRGMLSLDPATRLTAAQVVHYIDTQWPDPTLYTNRVTKGLAKSTGALLVLPEHRAGVGLDVKGASVSAGVA